MRVGERGRSQDDARRPQWCRAPGRAFGRSVTLDGPRRRGMGSGRAPRRSDRARGRGTTPRAWTCSASSSRASGPGRSLRATAARPCTRSRPRARTSSSVTCCCRTWTASPSPTGCGWRRAGAGSRSSPSRRWTAMPTTSRRGRTASSRTSPSRSTYPASWRRFSGWPRGVGAVDGAPEPPDGARRPARCRLGIGRNSARVRVPSHPGPNTASSASRSGLEPPSRLPTTRTTAPLRRRRSSDVRSLAVHTMTGVRRPSGRPR